MNVYNLSVPDVLIHEVVRTKKLKPSGFTTKEYFRFLYSNIIGVAFRGVFRTSIIHRENLLIKEDKNTYKIFRSI